MIRSLKKRPRPDELKSQQRKSTNSIGRLVYLGLVCLLAVGVLKFLFGDFLIMRADGLVVRDRTAIAVTYVARVEAVNVEAGQGVGKGNILLRLQSTEMLERLAELSAGQARLAARTVEFKIRSNTIESLLPLAARREQETGRMLKVFDKIHNRKLLTSARYDQALSAKFDAREAFIKLNVEGQAFKNELKTLEAARTDAAIALADLRTHYNGGVMRAPVTGSAGAVIPSVGNVYRPGESILSIYSGNAYVLAYLPRRYLFSITPEQKVWVSDGRTSAEGIIDKILPLTETVPKEFQNSFRPADRNQLARIRFVTAPPFPLHEKVSITKHGWTF